MIAPGYSSIITEPMDFSTMRYKIDNGIYYTLAEYKVCRFDYFRWDELYNGQLQVSVFSVLCRKKEYRRFEVADDGIKFIYPS